MLSQVDDRLSSAACLCRLVMQYLNSNVALNFGPEDTTIKVCSGASPFSVKPLQRARQRYICVCWYLFSLTLLASSSVLHYFSIGNFLLFTHTIVF